MARKRSQCLIYEEKALTCQDCGHQFLFTAAEQEFYAKKGLTDEPSRCPECRGARKARGEGSVSRGDGRGGQQEMFPAVCVQCGKDVRLPFQPRGDRPVYCPDCLHEQQGSSSGYRRPRGGRRY